MYNGAKQARGAGGKFGGKVAAAGPVLVIDNGARVHGGADLATDLGRQLEPGAAVPAAGHEDDSFAIMVASGGPGFARPATPDGVRLHMASLAAKGVAAADPAYVPFVAPRAQLVQAEAGAVAEYRRAAPGAIIPVLDERTSASKHVALILLIIGIIALAAASCWPSI